MHQCTNANTFPLFGMWPQFPYDFLMAFKHAYHAKPAEKASITTSVFQETTESFLLHSLILCCPSTITCRWPQPVTGADGALGFGICSYWYEVICRLSHSSVFCFLFLLLSIFMGIAALAVERKKSSKKTSIFYHFIWIVLCCLDISYSTNRNLHLLTLIQTVIFCLL